VDQVILRVLAAEVQRRTCPGCRASLRLAEISASFSGSDRVQLHFRCRFCVFEGGGEIELTSEIRLEAGSAAALEEREGNLGAAISQEEVAAVRDALAIWNGGVSELMTSGPPPALSS